MLLMKSVTFAYAGKRDFCLHAIDFSTSGGEIVTLLGPNGAGKTTLLRILSGLILPAAGKVIINGHDMLQDEAAARRSLGLVLGEERSFYYRLSGAQNLEFFGGLYGMQRRYIRKEISRLLGLVGLESDAQLQYMRYSTGMKKRLALALALLHDPQVLLLDEPSSGVDPGSARAIREIILQLRQSGKTILLTTHDMSEAERLSDRIAFLQDGRLMRTGTVDEFRSLINRKQLEVRFNNCRKAAPADLDQLAGRIHAIAPTARASIAGNGISISYNGSFDMNAVLRSVGQCGYEIEQVNTSGPSLEDVFLKLVGN